MNEYEVFIEDINSCGGEQYAKKELIEIEADSPEAYVQPWQRTVNPPGFPRSKEASIGSLHAVITR